MYLFRRFIYRQYARISTFGAEVTTLSPKFRQIGRRPISFNFQLNLTITSILLLPPYRRRTYTLQGILNSERKGKLFEHFIVTGLPPQVLAPTPFSPLNSPRSQRKAHSRHPSTATSGSSDGWTSYNPEILYCYPESPKYAFLWLIASCRYTFQKQYSSLDPCLLPLTSYSVLKFVTNALQNQEVHGPTIYLPTRHVF